MKDEPCLVEGSDALWPQTQSNVPVQWLHLVPNGGNNARGSIRAAEIVPKSQVLAVEGNAAAVACSRVQVEFKFVKRVAQAVPAGARE